MALHLKRDDSKAVLPNPEGLLSSSMPSCVRGSVTIHVRHAVGTFARGLEEPRLLSLRGAREGLALVRA